MSTPRSLILAGAALAGLALSPGLSAQATLQYILPGSNANSVDISPNGEWVSGGGGSSGGYIWSQSSGVISGVGSTGTFWGASNDGSVAAGEFLNGLGKNEAATWTPGGGLAFQGGHATAASCDAFFSAIFGLSSDGSTGVGMSWEACKTWPIRWTAGSGITLLAKQNPSVSARASSVSANGLVAGGWDQGTPGGTAGNRRASLWTDDLTQLFVATTPGNPEGLGEVLDLNTDGSVCSGVTNNTAFRWTAGGGLELLPTVPGLGGGYYANAISDDGSVAAGVRLQFPTAQAIIWPEGGGAMTMVDFLAANGVPGVPGGNMRNCTGVSADGSVICGWGNNGPWVVTLDKTWTDLGDGLSGTHGVPVLTGVGDLSAGSLVRLALSGALENAATGLVVGLSALNAPFKGGVLVPNPDFIVTGLTTNAGGGLTIAATWPAGVPSGFVTYFQEWVTDPAGPKGFAASNGLSGTAP